MNEEHFNSESNEYTKVLETTTQYEKQKYWDIAIGLQKVDGLKPSKYLLENLKYNIAGKVSDEEFESQLKNYYANLDLRNKEISNSRECDLVSSRIVNLISDDNFSLHPVVLKVIHGYLFNGIYDFAGEYRTYDICKKEIILNGESVLYTPFFQIKDVLDYDFNEEKKFNYFYLNEKEIIEHIVNFTSRIWEVHPFLEGNTRAVAVLIIKYLRSLNFDITNDLFKEHSIYFRNALVRSNYYNSSKKIASTNEYLIKFYENLLLGKNHELKSSDLRIDELFDKDEKGKIRVK